MTKYDNNTLIESFSASIERERDLVDRESKLKYPIIRIIILILKEL